MSAGTYLSPSFSQKKRSFCNRLSPNHLCRRPPTPSHAICHPHPATSPSKSVLNRGIPHIQAFVTCPNGPPEGISQQIVRETRRSDAANFCSQPLNVNNAATSYNEMFDLKLALHGMEFLDFFAHILPHVHDKAAAAKAQGLTNVSRATEASSTSCSCDVSDCNSFFLASAARCVLPFGFQPVQEGFGLMDSLLLR